MGKLYRNLLRVILTFPSGKGIILFFPQNNLSTKSRSFKKQKKYMLEDIEELEKQQVLESSRSCRVKAQRVNKAFGKSLFSEVLLNLKRSSES